MDASATKAKPTLTKAQRRTRSIRRVKSARHLTQAAFGLIILVAAWRHQVEGSGSPSVDALCPFGAVETLITWLTTGSLIAKTHPSNLTLGLAVLIAAVLVGNAFCGWICPFGAVQDALTWVRTKLHLPTVTLPRLADKVLRYGRYLVLAVVVYMSVVTARLWFADYDPYVQLFGLHWLFGADGELPWVGWGITIAVLGASVVIDRFWCRYLCPLGAMFAALGVFSLLRIRRAPSTCTDCTLCDRACPMGIEPAKAKPFASTDCIGCMDCLPTCPVPGALTLNGPVLLGLPLTKDPAAVSRKHREPVAAASGDSKENAR